MKALDDDEHRTFHEEEEKARIPVRAVFVIEVEADSRRIPLRLVEQAVMDALRMAHLRVKHIAPVVKRPTDGQEIA